MEEKVETKQLEKELEAKVGDLVGRFSESLELPAKNSPLAAFWCQGSSRDPHYIHIFWKNLLQTDKVINDMKDSIKRNLDAQLEIQRKTRQTLQGKVLHFW